MSPPLAGAAWTAQDSVPRPSPAAKARVRHIGARTSMDRCIVSTRIVAKESIVISVSIGSVSLNLAPPRAPAELIIVKLCEEAFAGFRAAAVIGIA